MSRGRTTTPQSRRRKEKALALLRGEPRRRDKSFDERRPSRPFSQTERVSGARRIGSRPRCFYGKVTTPAVLEIEAAVPVAVSAALLIQAPPVTNKPVSTRPATPAATLPASRFSG